MSRCRKRERSGRSGSRSLSPSPRPLRTARASFPACRSSRFRQIRKHRLWTVRSPFSQSIWCQAVSGEPRSFGAAGGPTVRTAFPIALLPALPTRPVGSQHPCRVGLSTHEGGPYPSHYRRAFAASHILYPLGIGRLYSRLSQLSDCPWGLPCSASRRGRRGRVTLFPGGGLSCRGTDYRPIHPLHIPFWSAPVSRFGSFDFTRVAGVHHVTRSVFPLARSPDAAPRGRYFSACFTPLRYQRRMTPMRRGGQARLGHCDHSCLTTFTSHLEAVGSMPLFGDAYGMVLLWVFSVGSSTLYVCVYDLVRCFLSGLYRR